VLVAPETASREEIENAANALLKVHDGPFVVLPHNWSALPIETIRAQLDAIEKSPPTIGPSKPPPPPPPPT
jgi:hypothetical protein